MVQMSEKREWEMRMRVAPDLRLNPGPRGSCHGGLAYEHVNALSPPRKLEPDLVRVRAFWESLKRGDADMPFWDDVNLSSLPDLSGRLMLVDVFDKPVRFRLEMLGEQLQEQHGGDVIGKFLDEIDARRPLQYLNSQSSATVESRAPTYYRHGSAKRSGSSSADIYSRLLLPMWGDGRIGMLLGGVAWG